MNSFKIARGQPLNCAVVIASVNDGKSRRLIRITWIRVWEELKQYKQCTVLANSHTISIVIEHIQCGCYSCMSISGIHGDDYNLC